MNPADTEDGDSVVDEKVDHELFSRVVDLLRKRDVADEPKQAGATLEVVADELDSFLVTHPDSVPALRLLAECAQRLGDLSRARGYITRAERLEPWNLEILIISESLYESEASAGGQRPGKPPRLRTDLSSGVVNADKLIEKAMGSFRLGDLDRAYTLSKLAYLVTPDLEHHLMDILAVGSSLDPRLTYDELVGLAKMGSPPPFLLLALGSICNVLGNYEEATSWLSMGIEVFPEDPYVKAMFYNELAYVMIKQRIRLDKCIELARAALELFPDKNANGFIRDTLGVAYLTSGEVGKAIRNLREAVSKDPTVIPRFHLALALLRNKDPAAALGELKQIADSRPSLESPHVEETAILERVQSCISRLENLLNLGGAGDIRDALEMIDGLV